MFQLLQIPKPQQPNKCPTGPEAHFTNKQKTPIWRSTSPKTQSPLIFSDLYFIKTCPIRPQIGCWRGTLWSTDVCVCPPQENGPKDFWFTEIIFKLFRLWNNGPLEQWQGINKTEQWHTDIIFQYLSQRKLCLIRPLNNYIFSSTCSCCCKKVQLFFFHNLVFHFLSESSSFYSPLSSLPPTNLRQVKCVSRAWSPTGLEGAFGARSNWTVCDSEELKGWTASLISFILYNYFLSPCCHCCFCRAIMEMRYFICLYMSTLGLFRLNSFPFNCNVNHYPFRTN